MEIGNDPTGHKNVYVKSVRKRVYSHLSDV